MQLARAFRSLPRPSSLFKPSYPSNSLVGSTLSKISLKTSSKLKPCFLVRNYFTTFIISKCVGEYCFHWTWYAIKRICFVLQLHPRFFVANFICCVIFLKAFLAFSWFLLSMICDFTVCDGLAGNRTRDSSVQAKCFTTRLRAHEIGASSLLAPGWI